MLSEIKKKIEGLKGKPIKIWVDIGRNKNETYDGYVLDTYKNIWTFKTKTDIKSFCYSDILTNSVVISSWYMDFFSRVYWFLSPFMIKLKCIY